MAGQCLGQGDPDTSGRGGAEPGWGCAKGAAPQQSFHIPALAHRAWHEAHAVPAPATYPVPSGTSQLLLLWHFWKQGEWPSLPGPLLPWG